MIEFGVLPDGRPVHLLSIGAAPGVEVQVLTLGATAHRVEVTGGDGRRRDVVLGQPTVEDRLASGDYLGGTVGRYPNRIAGGRFAIDGASYDVGAHDRGNSLHGGPDGFDRRVWEVVEHGPTHVRLALDSPDGDQGFPGAVHAETTYAVDGDVVRISLRATTDAPTVVGLTNHAYFNLDGEGSGTIDRHLLTLHADAWTPVDATGIPTGAHEPVDGTPFDFRVARRLGPAIRDSHPQVVAARGIDHNVVVRGAGLRPAAVLESASSAIRLEVGSDQPGLQVYTANALDGSAPSSAGGRHRQGDGIALEPQWFPDSPHHPEWPSPVLRPGETFEATLEWRFVRLPD